MAVVMMQGRRRDGNGRMMMVIIGMMRMMGGSLMKMGVVRRSRSPQTVRVRRRPSRVLML